MLKRFGLGLKKLLKDLCVRNKGIEISEGKRDRKTKREGEK